MLCSCPSPVLFFLGLFTGGVLQKRESLFVAMTSCTTPKKRMVMKPHAVFFRLRHFSFSSGAAFLPSLWRRSMEASPVAEIGATPLPS